MVFEVTFRWYHNYQNFEGSIFRPKYTRILGKGCGGQPVANIGESNFLVEAIGHFDFEEPLLVKENVD
jgi:hypothetical protein